MITPRSETTPGTLRQRILDDSAGDSPDARYLAEETFAEAWFEIERLEGARLGALGRGFLSAAPVLSTGSANALVAFRGRELIPAGWRQGRGTIDPTGANNGLVWELIEPGDQGDLIPMARSIHYDGAKHLAWVPNGRVATILLVPGVARSLVVSPATRSAIVTFIGGTTTYAQIAADWAASYDALQLGTLTGDAGTLPATFEGGVLYLSRAPLVEYVQAAGPAVDWDSATRVVTVGFDIAGGGDSVADILAALAASASGAQYVVQVRNLYGSNGAGNITTAGITQLIGGAGKAMRRGILTMVQGSNKDLELEARNFGSDALPVYAALVHGAAVEPPTVAVSVREHEVYVSVTAKVGTATALQLRQALRDSTAAMEWFSVRLADGSDGSGTPAAFGLTVLGESGDAGALGLRAGTVPMTGITALTDDGFTTTIPALGASHPAGSTVAVHARIAGVMHEISAAVVA
jgi:hypothetical protein